MRWRWLRTDGKRRLSVSPYRVLISIGEEWIQVLLVELEPHSAVIVGAARENRGGYRTADAIESVSDQCERAVSEAERSTESALGYRVVADYGLVAVPDSWSVMAGGTITHRRREPERRVDAQELRGALDRAVAFVLSQQEGDVSASEVEVIYSCVTEARMDGQRVRHPLGFRGQELSLGIFLSLVHRERARYLRGIASDLDLDPVRLVPLLQAMAVCLPAPEAIGILLDDKHTDVFRVMDGRVAASQRVPGGVQDMLIKVMDALSMPAADARRLQREHRRGLLDPELAERVEQELLEQMWSWAVSLRSAVKGVGQDTVPWRVYLCGAEEGMSTLQQVLDCPEWRQGLRFARHPQITCFGPKDVVPLLDRVGDSRRANDLGVRCLAIFAHSERARPSRVDALLKDALRARGYLRST